MDWANLKADEDRILTKHFTKGRGGKRINKVIVHHNAANLSIAGCFNVWQNRPASAHYQVDSHGRVGQLVWDADTAWHASNFAANQTSIGIEHADVSSNPWRISDAALESGAHLVAAICTYYKLGRPEWGRNLFGHSDFAATQCPASLAVGGSQHDAYVRRAQEWYDAMAGKPAPAQNPEDVIKEVKMTTAALITPTKDGKPLGFVAFWDGVQLHGLYQADQPEAVRKVYAGMGQTVANFTLDDNWFYRFVTAVACTDEGIIETAHRYFPNEKF